MDVNERIRGAIWGQIVGDAITLGSHWIYEPKKMQQQFPQGIEGFEPPFEGHYHFGKVPGDSTHYGEGCRLMLQSIAEKRAFDSKDFLKRFQSFFGSPYYKGYLDHATRETLENIEASIDPPGANDDQMATATRIAPVVGLYHGRKEMQAKVEEATRIGQNNQKAVAYLSCAAAVLSDLLSGLEVKAAFEKQLSHSVAGPKIKEALALSGKSFFEATRTFGPSCLLDETFPCVVYASVLSKGSFKKAVLMNTEAGGDSAGRGGLLGAWLGAYQGMGSIPEEWVMKIRGKELIHYWIEELIASREL